MPSAKRRIQLIKIIVPILGLMLASLACSFSQAEPTPDTEATAFALNTTATVLSIQSTQLALEANQQASQPTQAPPKQNSTPAPLPTQAPLDTAPVYTSDFYIINDSDFTICYFYLSPTSAEDWGDDQLGDTTVLPGETFTLTDVPYDTYDLSARDCSDEVLYEEFSIDFPYVDQFTLSNSYDEPLCGNGVCGDFENPGNCPQDCGYEAGNIPLTIINQTSETVCYVWIGYPYSEWVGDILGDQTIPGWGSVTVYIEPGEWALMAEDCSGDAGLSQMKLTESISIYDATTWYVDP